MCPVGDRYDAERQSCRLRGCRGHCRRSGPAAVRRRAEPASRAQAQVSAEVEALSWRGMY